MPSIKIIATPPGQAPLKIREQWVGVTIPMAANLPANTYQMGVFGGQAEYEHADGYGVETEIAMQALAQKSPEAANWWRQNVMLEVIPWLSFHKDACEILF